MKVFIVTKSAYVHDENTAHNVEGVFSSEMAAKKYCAEKNGGYYDYEYTEYEVEN